MDDSRMLTESELDAISGGQSDEEKREEEKRRKERSLHGFISKDMLGNVTFTDKTGAVGSFTADEWNKLRKNWDYTGNPEYWMETINVNELKGMEKA